ncbi:unnamed protein product [Cylindrotheca closterium]|uniref:Uncharacterized protein n=1 Tax=Cylindrotheca closterium TaxID=2856 RepID=A0AAD2CU42_9STRA|nr:unnamed protein product [Cylindrotheca closterium]
MKQDEEGAVAERDSKGGAASHRCKGLIVILLLLALGSGLYMVLRSKAPDINKDARNDPSGRTDFPSGAPRMESKTNMPSLNPTTPPMFGPPSIEDCIPIARGKAIDGQDEMLLQYTGSGTIQSGAVRGKFNGGPKERFGGSCVRLPENVSPEIAIRKPSRYCTNQRAP